MLLIISVSAKLSGAQDGAQDRTQDRTQDKTSLLSDLDIPLMQDFLEDEDSRVVFDTPDGRIIEVRARGQKGQAAVANYYNMLLPSLGWRLAVGEKDSCGDQAALCVKAQRIEARRDGEILTIEIKEIKGLKEETYIYFAVNPE